MAVHQNTVPSGCQKEHWMSKGAGVHFFCSFENIKYSWIPKFSLRQNGFMNDLHMFALRMRPISDCTQLGKRGFGLEPIAWKDFASMTVCLLHWSHTQYLEGHSSNAHLRVSSVILIIWRIRCVWLGLELNCAELWGIECETKLPTHHWSRSYNCVFFIDYQPGLGARSYCMDPKCA